MSGRNVDGKAYIPQRCHRVVESNFPHRGKTVRPDVAGPVEDKILQPLAFEDRGRCTVSETPEVCRSKQDNAALRMEFQPTDTCIQFIDQRICEECKRVPAESNDAAGGEHPDLSLRIDDRLEQRKVADGRLCLP